MKNAVQYDIAVVGAGPAGLAAALCLSRLGPRVALIGPPPDRSDTRTAALFTGSVQLLRNLGAWEHCNGAAEALVAIRILDDMGALLRAPEVLFTAAEVGLDTFGYNVPNGVLAEGLHRQAVAASDRITRVETCGVTGLVVSPGHVEVHLADGSSLPARLVVGADGRNSVCRSAAQIGTRTWRYEQSALTCTFAHQRAHHGISTEFHRPAGPLTVVPLPGRASSLVWVERPAAARRLHELDDATFRAALETRLQGLLGPIGEIGPRGLFPLSGLTAEAAGRNRVALVGEAAHIIPPIGAQGLNLGFRDAAILADCVCDRLQKGDDAGTPEALAAYARARRLDIATRAWSIDMLNRSLISGFLPIQLLRGAGLFALKTISPLRRLAIREGLAPSFLTPRMMQGLDGDRVMAR
jgi:2-octaprenyl-6-methoxyphenol hydroxylase